MKLHCLFLIFVIISVNFLLGMDTNQSLIEIDKKTNGIVNKEILITAANANLDNIHGIYCIADLNSLLGNCTEINLSHNKLNAKLFEPLFSTLPYLTKLDVSHNKIKCLPNIVHCKLVHLNLNHNQITKLHLPNIISSLRRLTYLSARHNKITTLHEDTLKPNYDYEHPLKDLQLSDNQIPQLNLTNLLDGLQKLKNLDLSGNPLNQVDSDHINLRYIITGCLTRELYIPTISFQKTLLEKEAQKKLLINSSPSWHSKGPLLALEFSCGFVMSLVPGVVLSTFLLLSGTVHSANDAALYSFVPVEFLYIVLFCIYAKTSKKYQRVHKPLFDEQNSDVEKGTNIPLLDQ